MYLTQVEHQKFEIIFLILFQTRAKLEFELITKLD